MLFYLIKIYKTLSVNNINNLVIIYKMQFLKTKDHIPNKVTTHLLTINEIFLFYFYLYINILRLKSIIFLFWNNYK